MDRPPRSSPAPDPEGERLAKRLARERGCSRSEAERYIESGCVTVDGVTATSPAQRVHDTQRVALTPDATLEAVEPVTLLLHRPPGVAADPAVLLAPRARHAGDRSGIRPVRAHLHRQACVAPLEPSAGGLVVFSQDPRIVRRLVEDAALLEHEWMIEVTGPVSPEALARVAAPLAVGGRTAPAARVSIGSQSDQATRLRVAVKGHHPGRFERACAAAGLPVRSIRRTRIGRVSLAPLGAGEWRYLAPGERF
jgi:23S rRNA pseudouridine2604 synthase